MSVFLENPRRAPRVPVLLHTDLAQGTMVWRAVTVDFGTGGCLLIPGRPLDEHARLILEVKTDDLPDVLSVTGSIAWQDGPRAGVRFGFAPRGVDPREWFLRLLACRPRLQEVAERSPSRIALDAIASRTARPVRAFRLTSDELRVLSHVRQRTLIQSIQKHARIPPHYFTRAFFSLLEKGLIVVAQPRALTAAQFLRAVR